MIDQHQAVNPYMVILGRESRGLSQKVLADQLGITQGRISKIEKGILVLPDELLERLSRILDYPQHFFYQDGVPVGVGIAEIYHRKRQDVPKGDLAKIYAQMEIRFKHMEVLLHGTEEILCRIPRLDIEAFDEQAETIADLVREALKVPPGPIDDLTKLIEEAGILVVPMDFGTMRVDAISRWIPDFPPLMFVNMRGPKDRYRYSIAHELGHLVMHALPNPDIEEQANQFAAEFLLPGKEIRAQLFKLNLSELVRLKLKWKVSMAAILMRAQKLGTITSNNARYLWMQMAKAGYKTREPVELDVKGEHPSRLKKLIEAYLKACDDSLTNLGKALALNESELRALYFQEFDPLPSQAIHQRR